MATENTLKIDYLIKAVDEASSVVKKIDKELEKVEKSTSEANKATQQLGNTQKNIFDEMKNGYNKAGELANKYGLSLVAITGFLSVATNKVLDFAEAIGEDLTKAMNENVKAFAEDELQGKSFAFIVDSISKATQGASGSLDEWNQVISETVESVGTTTETVQKSVREFLVFGNSLGTTKDQMKKLIPIASNLAVVNGIDLNQALDAVALGLNGQTRNLQTLGIVIKQGDIEKLAKQFGLNSKNLTEAQKQQLIYNAILNKSSILAKTAQEIQKTLEFRLKKQASQWDELRSAIGAGGAIIEEVRINSFQKLIDTLNGLGPEFLSTIGLVGSLAGGFLTGASSLIRFTLELGLLVAGIYALNAAMTSQMAIGFVASLKETEAVVRLLNGSFGPLTKSVLSIAEVFTTGGLTIRTAISAISLAMSGLIAQTATLLLAWSPWIALAGLIAGAVYVVWEALKRVEEQTGIFSEIWASFINLFSDLGVFEALSSAFSDMGSILSNVLETAITYTAIGMIKLANVVNELRIGFVYLVEYIKGIPDAITRFVEESLNAIKRLATELYNKFGSLIGITNAYAGEIDEVNRAVSEGTKAKQGLNEEDKKAIELIQGQINYNQNIIDKLKNRTQAEIEVAKEAEKTGKIATQATKNQTVALEQLDSALSSIKLSASEEIVMSISSAGVSSAFKEVTNQVVEMKKKIDSAKKEEIPALVESLKDLENKSIELKFLSNISAGLEFGKAIGGGASSVLKLAGKALGTEIGGPFGAIIGDMIGQVIDIFGKSPEAFKKMIMDVVNEIPQILMMIWENIYQTLPEILDDAIISLIDAFPVMAEKFTEIFISKITDPMFAIRLAVAITKALIRAIPNIIGGILKGLGNGLSKGLIGGLVKSFNGVAKVFNDIGKFFSNIGKVFSGLGSKLKKLAPILLAPLAIALAPLIGAVLLVVLIVKNFNKIVTFFKGVVNGAIEFFKKIPEYFQKFFDFLLQLPSMIVKAFFDGISAIIKFLATAFQQIVAFLASIPQMILDGFVMAFNFLVEMVGQVITLLTDAFMGIVNFLLTVPQMLWDGFVAFFDMVKNIFTDLINGLVDFIAKLPKAVINFITNIANSAIKFGAKILEFAGSFGRKILDGASRFGTKIYNSAINFGKEVVKGAGRVVTELVNGIKGSIGSIIPGLGGGGGIFGSVIGSVGGAIGSISDALGFAQGGVPALVANNGLIVPGQSTRGDNIPVRVNSREMILTMDQQARLFKMLQGELDSKNSRPVEIHTTVELDSRVLGKAIDKLDVNGWRR